MVEDEHFFIRGQKHRITANRRKTEGVAKINKLSKTDTPCYGCTERVVGCHSECQKYKAFQAKQESVKRRWDYENAAHQYEVQRYQVLARKCGKGRQP